MGLQNMENFQAWFQTCPSFLQRRLQPQKCQSKGLQVPSPHTKASSRRSEAPRSSGLQTALGFGASEDFLLLTAAQFVIYLTRAISLGGI